MSEEAPITLAYLKRKVAMSETKTLEEQPEKYASLHDVPTKQLVTNFIHAMIMAKGNVNLWAGTFENFIADYRKEEKEREEILRKLKERHQPHPGFDGSVCSCMQIPCPDAEILEGRDV